ncbi:uncharacterized protein [Epargyreus clarus]|uniref:uncharacterized protein n=1 Tax=Epargyreus clarus TaxID=520877 RepID=UPI003C2B3D25
MKMLNCKNVKTRFKSWLDKRTFRPHKLRETLVGCIATIIVCEVACYKMLQASVLAGDLPQYAPDVMIIVLAMIESVVSPFVSWFGYKRRRTMMILLMPVLLLTLITWLLLPETRDKEESDCMVSLWRVISNRLVLSQMLALGVLTAGLWGYGYHYSEIVKASVKIPTVKFLTYQNSTRMIFFTETIQYVGIVMSVVYIGLKWSAPIQQEFCKLRALMQALKMSVFAGVIVLVMALAVTCEHGTVAGLTEDNYIHPSCSAMCGCTPLWKEFSPVCVLDDMTTYLSPCHAGCGGALESLHKLTYQCVLRVYKNCTCAARGRAAVGACGAAGCGAARALHRMLYVLLLTVGVLAIQAHAVLLLKTVDPRDKSVVLGLAGSFVAMFAFVIGHIIFNGITVATCIWGVENCNLNSQRLPLLVSQASAVLVFTSALICLVNFIHMKVTTKRQEDSPNTEITETVE